MQFRILLIFLLTIVCPAAAVAEPAPELFSSAPVTFDRLQSRQYDRYVKMGSTAAIRAAELVVEPHRLDAVRLNFFKGEVYQAKRTSLEETAGEYIWEGTLGDGGTAILVIRGSQITGWVQVSQKQGGDLVYSISPIGGRVHVVRRTNQAWFDSIRPGCTTGAGERKEREATAAPDDDSSDPDEWLGATGLQAQAQAAARPADPVTLSSGCIVNVLVAYTPAAQAAHGNIPMLAHLAAHQTRVGYNNSKVTGLHLNVVGTMPVNYNESYTFTGGNATDLVRLRDVDGYMDEVHTARANLGADIVVLFAHDLDTMNILGQAAAILASSGTAFAIVDWEAAADNLTFAHELGHLQGARHHDDSTTTPFEYGHGSCRGWPYNYKTIMGTSACNETRVPYWSNPDVKYNNRKTGDDDFRNNARVLRETACTMAGLTGPGLMGWSWLWGNGGNDRIDMWYLNSNDRLVPGDYDGDGADELMAVNPNGFAHLMKYSGGWSTPWFNNGSGTIHMWHIGPADAFLSGDLIPGNWRDELLGIHAAAGYAHVMTYNGAAWTTPWANGGSGSIHWWLLSTNDRYVIGDFIPSNGRDELLAIQPTNGFAHLMAWNGSGFSTPWSNNGSDLLDTWMLGTGDRYVAGDFLPGNGRDELLVVSSTGSARVLAFNGSAWTTLWSNNGNGKIVGWTLTTSDRYTVGDYLPSSPGEELLAVNTAGSSQMFSFTTPGWQVAWSNNGSGNIGLWFINSPDRYLSGNFITGDLRDELLSIQPLSGWSHLHNRW